MTEQRKTFSKATFLPIFQMIGMAFAEAPVENGIPRLLGSTGDRLTMIELLGADDELKSITAICTFASDNEAAAARNGMILGTLVSLSTPGWPGAASWIAGCLKHARTRPQTHIQVKGKWIQFQFIPRSGIAIMQIENRHASA